MEGMIRLTQGQMNESLKSLAQTTGPTISTDNAGSALTVKALQPVLFLRSIVDGATNQHFFLNFCNQVTLPKGTHQISIPKRTKYLGRDTGTDGLQISTSEPDGSDITVTTIDNMDGVSATPTPRYAGVAVTNYNLRVNAVNLLSFAREELTYGIGDELDREIATTIGDATDASSATTFGAQTIYGGDATSDNGLAAGDVITTDMVAKAAKYLKRITSTWWNSGTETAGANKNPWMPTSSEPFALFVGPSQEETFRKDSQFVNAAEYGSDRIVKNGEIGEYLGIKIIVTNNVEYVASGGTSPDDAQTGGTTTTGTDMTRCILLKSKKACTLAWGQKPQLKVFDYPQRDQTWITMISAWKPVVVHADAIVFVDVAEA